MKHWILLAVLAFICCNSSDRAELLVRGKDYDSKHAEALSFCQKNSMNTDFYFLVDLSVHSGRNRFFVYDFKKRKVVDQGLATHGSCDNFEENQDKWEKARFSNTDNSHCSSSGKYKVGTRDYSSWGIKVKYWLHGLEKTNSNAQKRVIVLHSWEAVAAAEIYPEFSPLSWGCPAVSDAFMERLDEKLKETKNVLLWVLE